MKEEIEQTERFADEEKRLLFGWGEDIFGVSSLNLRWRPKQLHFLLRLDGKAVSHVGLLRHEVSVAGESMTVGGIGGVVTLPEAQGRGFARRLMKRAMEVAERDSQVDAGLLFCLERLVPYYEALGWQLVNDRVLIEQPNGKIGSPLKVMVLPCGGFVWPVGEVELNSFPW